MKIIPAQPLADVERIAVEPEQPAIGRWYWYKIEDGAEACLGTVHHVGSNYVELVGPTGEHGSQWRDRVHFDDFDAKLTCEPDAASIIAGKVGQHREESQNLLREVQRITAALGVAPRQALTEEAAPIAESTTALAAVASTEDIKAHKQALILAKEKQLPDLFKQIEAEHALMAHWMTANTLPDRARLEQMEGSIKRIDGQIFTVELYAGLIEEVVQVRGGAAAPNDTKLVLFQRRHYMDEEALVRYEAGGMEFEDLDAFDAWLARDENFTRILPSPRCVVAFKVRRFSKARVGYSLRDWIHIGELEKLDKRTFLYIRNGEQLHRLATDIDFGEQLFPDQEHNELLTGGALWWDDSFGAWRVSTDRVRSQREHDAQWEDYREQQTQYEEDLKEWKLLSKKQKREHPRWVHGPEKPNAPQLTLIDAKNVYYDDAMEVIAKLIREHNQIAVLLQGLLDRSRVFHPHPPWQLWTPAGFLAAIELVYDDSRAITPGDAPDFLAYARNLNKQITEGSMVIGQRAVWGAKEAEKENARRGRRGRRDRWDTDVEWFAPYGNSGPNGIAKVERHTSTGRCTFTWEREKQRLTAQEKWEPHPSKPGYLWRRRDKDGHVITPMVPDHIVVDQGLLFNVSAYRPGDFRQFYDDSRTRAQYLKWAPFMLLAEDYHAGKEIDQLSWRFRTLLLSTTNSPRRR